MDTSRVEVKPPAIWLLIQIPRPQKKVVRIIVREEQEYDWVTVRTISKLKSNRLVERVEAYPAISSLRRSAR